MRILTVLSGILLSAAGVFCFAFSTHLFADMAFPVGCAMVAEGILVLIAYLISGRKTRLPETLLVEGIISCLFGFAVLNNQVADNMLATFFGAWLCIGGANRLSQSITVSRFKPKDWFKILPLSAIACLVGAIMMMPTLYVGTPAIMLVAFGFIINGMSLFVYAMYMKPPVQKQKELEAQARAEAKQLAAAEKRKETARLRSMNHNDRVAEQKRIKEAKKAEKNQKREEKKAAKEEAKAAKFDPSKTIRMSDEEVELINQAAKEAGLDEKIAEAEKEAEQTQEQSLYPVFNAPTAIPTLRTQADETATPELDEVELSAVNLEEIENSTAEVEFEDVELPEVEMHAEGGEAEKRDEILSWLRKRADGSKDTEEPAEYTPLEINELLADTPVRKQDPADVERFTQKLNITWLPDETKE